MQLEEYVEAPGPDDIRVKGYRIGLDMTRIDAAAATARQAWHEQMPEVSRRVRALIAERAKPHEAAARPLRS